MPLDFKVEKIRVVTGSMEYTISALAITNPNGTVTEPSGSLLRTQDGRTWVNVNGGTVWHPYGPTKFDTVISGSLTGTLDATIGRNLTVTQRTTTQTLTASLDATVTRNLGVGTAAPGAALDVRNSQAGVGVAMLRNNHTNGYGALDFYDHTNTHRFSIGVDNGLSRNFIGSITRPIIITGAGSGGATSLTHHFGTVHTQIYFQILSGNSAAVSDVNTARLRYETNANSLQVSTNGGSYFEILSGSGGGLSLPGNFTASLDAKVGRDLSVTGNLSVQGSITGSGDVKFGRNLWVVNAITASYVAITGSTGLDNWGYTNLHGATHVGNSLDVVGSITGSGDVLFGRNVTAGVVGSSTHNLNGDVRTWGTDTASVFNWSGAAQQDTYIRAGKTGGQVIIGDNNTGSIQVGAANNTTYFNGATIFNNTYTYFANTDANLNCSASPGNMYIRSNAGILYLNPNAGNGTIILGYNNTNRTEIQGQLTASQNVLFSSYTKANALVDAQSSVYVTGTLDARGKAVFRGNIGSGVTPVQAVEFVAGRNSTDTVPGTTGGDIAFNWYAAGYKHFISTHHDAAANSRGNAMRFWLNDSATAGGSSSPNTGSFAVFSLMGDRTANLSATLYVSGGLTVAQNANLNAVTTASMLQIGTNSTNLHALIGNFTANATDPVAGKVLGYENGNVKWIALSGAGGVSGGGTTNYIAKWIGNYAIGDSRISDAGSYLEISNVGFVHSTTGSTAWPHGLFVQHFGPQASAIAADSIGIKSDWGTVVVDTDAAIRNVYGVSVNASVSRSNGANTARVYGILVNSENEVDANNNWAIYSSLGNVRLNANGTNYTRVGGFFADSDTIFNYSNYESGGTSQTYFYGRATMFSGSTTYGAVTGTLDAKFDRNVSAGADLTASVDARVGRNLAVVGQVSAATVSGTTYTVSAQPARLFLGRQIKTSNGTYTPTAGTKAILVKMVGAGGGGGGAGGGAGAATAGGGASGMYFEKWFSSVTSATGSCTVSSTGGSGGANTGGTGGTGGDTVFAINGVTYIAKGGAGGVGGTSTTGTSFGIPGQPQAGSSTGDINASESGQWGLTIVGGYFPGSGASCPLGGGGATKAGPNAGVAATGYGSGGGGATAAASGQTGGAGAPGVIIIEEYG